MHDVEADAPVVERYVPTKHSVHEVEADAPVEERNVPAGHPRQIDAPIAV